MKSLFFAIVLGMASMAHAAPLQSKVALGLSFSSTSAVPVFQAANRKGSTRVGGSGRSGKGSRYVGGRSK